MSKLFFALSLVVLASKSLVAQDFTGAIYGAPVSVHLESVGKNAWQGYLVYEEECYSVALVRLDSQPTVSKVKFGFIGAKLVAEPTLGFSISGDPSSDSIRLSEKEIVKFPSATVPEKMTVTLQKSKWTAKHLLTMLVYKEKFALTSNSIQISGSERQVPCSLDSNLIGIWERADGEMFLSVHADGNLMMFSRKPWELKGIERPENRTYINQTVWCTGDGILYLGRVNQIAQYYGAYAIQQDNLTLPPVDGVVMNFKRK